MSELPTYKTFNSTSTEKKEPDAKNVQEKFLSILKYAAGVLILFVGFLFLYDKVFVADSVVDLSSNPASSTKSSSGGKGASSKTPNFVFIYIDDLGFGSIGYNQYDIYGASPFMTSLIESGLFFTQYYGQEECTPSRSALMTGRYPITTGMQYHLVQPMNDWGLNTTEILLPQVMKDNGYATYGVGKWHLGHYTNEMLPTARGFDQFIGYMSGEIYPWSKKTLSGTAYYNDELYMDTECFSTYSSDDFSDAHSYSTSLYRSMVQKVLNNHDFTSKPMFLYVPFQAVHDPFRDIHMYTKGLNATMVGDTIYDTFSERIAGSSRLQYALTLYLLDKAVEEIYSTLSSIGQLDNTYFIVASDNGGCYDSGGRNGDLRGCKGTLFEGAMRVDAFISSPLLPTATRGQNYTNLFHVSDWFPTILSLAGIEYTPESGHELDGVDHAASILSWNADGSTDDETSPRSDLIYNIYLNIDSTSYNTSNYPFAVRNSQYKYMRVHAENDLTIWYNFEEQYEDDDDLSKGKCSQDTAASGTLTYFLFDLINDPNETTNLYDSTDATYVAAKEELQAIVEEYATKVKEDTYSAASDSLAKTTFTEYDSFIVPWYTTGAVQYCTPTTYFTK